MPTYETLVRDYHNLAFRVARTIVRDDASAEDAVQDVYLRFLRDPASLERAENLKAFVARAAVNAALDQKRGAGRREKHENAAAMREGVGMRATNPVEAASRAELRSKVAELPEEQRLAVEMHYFTGLTKGETAHALQVPEGTVSSRLNTALERLRKVLSAAAFAGLLAMLESEAGTCAAGEAAPEGLSERLLKLRKRVTPSAPEPVRTSRRWPAVMVAGGTLVAVLVALVVRHKLHERASNPQDPSSISAIVNSASGGSTSIPVAGKPPDPLLAEKPAIGVPATEETILEGFLFHRDGGVFVRDISAWDHVPKQTIWDEEAETAKAWRESLTIAGGVKGLAATEAADFGPFLLHDGAVDKAPQVRVRVKVRGAGMPEYNKDDQAYTKRTMQAPDFKPQRVELVEVLEAEVLGAAWLTAWREMQMATADLVKAWELPPGPEKRTAMLDGATRLGTAWEAARSARRGSAKVDWRIQRESESVAGSVDRLAKVGLEGLLPSTPSADHLHDAVMEAASPKDLRDRVTRLWGAETMALSAWCYRPNQEGGHSWSQFKLSDLAAMGEAEYRTLHAQLESIAENRPKPEDGPAMADRRREERAKVAAFGLEVESLSALDRERHLVECGALVRVVTPGTAADRLGLRAGDIVWKITVEYDSKQNKAVGDVPVWGEAGLATQLQDTAVLGERVRGLKVLRGDETVEIRIRE